MVEAELKLRLQRLVAKDYKLRSPAVLYKYLRVIAQHAATADPKLRELIVAALSAWLGRDRLLAANDLDAYVQVQPLAMLNYTLNLVPNASKKDVVYSDEGGAFVARAPFYTKNPVNPKDPKVKAAVALTHLMALQIIALLLNAEKEKSYVLQESLITIREYIEAYIYKETIDNASFNNNKKAELLAEAAKVIMALLASKRLATLELVSLLLSIAKMFEMQKMSLSAGASKQFAAIYVDIFKVGKLGLADILPALELYRDIVPRVHKQGLTSLKVPFINMKSFLDDLYLQVKDEQMPFSNEILITLSDIRRSYLFC